MRLHRKDIHAIEQPVEFTTGKLDDLGFQVSRPGKAILLQLLLPKNKTVAFPEEKLHVISAPVAESEQVSAERVEFQFFLDQHR